MNAINRPVVFLAEDEPLIAIDIETAFIEAGFDVVIASTIRSALDWLLENIPAIAVLDVRLGRDSAGEIAAKLRESGVPILIHTAIVERELSEEFRGFPVFFKPVNYEDMVRTARMLML